jgi:hypothetical protein
MDWDVEFALEKQKFWRKEYNSLKKELRLAAQKEADLYKGLFAEKYGVIKPISKTVRGTNNKKLTGGEWDWWTDGQISKQEKARLRKSGYIAEGGFSPDVFGLEKGADEYLDLTRRIDILQKFAKTGKLAEGAAYR